jgi:hypothetical protein
VLKKKESEEEKKARLQDEKENAITIEDFLETEVFHLILEAFTRRKCNPRDCRVLCKMEGRQKSKRTNGRGYRCKEKG